jgi:hypothetical protein
MDKRTNRKNNTKKKQKEEERKSKRQTDYYNAKYIEVKEEERQTDGRRYKQMDRKNHLKNKQTNDPTNKRKSFYRPQKLLRSYRFYQHST